MEITTFYYDIIYRIRGQQDKSTIVGLNENILGSYLKQLKNLSVSFNGDVVNKFEDLDYFKIIKKNYKYRKEGMYYTEEPYDSFGLEFQDLPTLGDLLIEMNDDVTNELLFDYGITGQDAYMKGKVILEYNSPEDSFVYVDSHKIKLEEGSKGLELFRLVFTASDFYKTDKLTYNKLKKTYNDSGIEFKDLKFEDLSQVEINSFLGKKLKTIQDKCKMKEKCLLVTSAYVSIWQQKAVK